MFRVTFDELIGCLSLYRKAAVVTLSRNDGGEFKPSNWYAERNFSLDVMRGVRRAWQ